MPARPCRGGERCHAHSGGEVGRPTKLTDEIESNICDAFRAGNYLEVAADVTPAFRVPQLIAGSRTGRSPDGDPR